MSQQALFQTKRKTSLIVPRAYQTEAHDEAFRQFDRGMVGSLIRIFTGGGKTLTACMLSETWLSRGDDYRCMIISYEKQLVWQFAQEIDDWLAITPGIEMEKERIDGNIPKIVVSSRQSLMLAKPATEQQRAEFKERGIEDIGACPQTTAKRLLRLLKKNAPIETIKDELWNLNQREEASDGTWSRLHKFDPSLNWLLIWDEAHKHAYRLTTVGHIADWFDKNPNSRRVGLTATPKRFDGVSIGHKMFPGIAVDYPLFTRNGRCAVKDGYAVPYIQKYISVEGVDFKQLKKVAGDFTDEELGRVLGEEETLAKLCQPTLELVGDRRTLIFSPTVDMAKAVVSWINARKRCECNCGTVAWYPTLLIGDGAKCRDCGNMIDGTNVVSDSNQSHVVWGSLPPDQRKEIYKAHQSGAFQFLVVCGLCREGYNDPEISAVAIFRPVSKAASSLAEQMKGRGSRPKRGLIEGVEDKEERLRLIQESDKPNCLIVDLVGITGLGDCASTAMIYAEGLDDETIELAEELLVSGECDDVEEAVEKAELDVAAERERIKQERIEAERKAREEFEKRAKADADVSYSEHDIGNASDIDLNAASEKQYGFLRRLGMEIIGRTITKRQAGRMIDQLLKGEDPERVAYTNQIGTDHWRCGMPSAKQLSWLHRKGITETASLTPMDASNIISASKEPAEFERRFRGDMERSESNEQLDAIAKRLQKVRKTGLLQDDIYSRIVMAGRQKRNELNTIEDEF